MLAARSAGHIVLIVHYFPPINSSGAKRAEALAKYFTRAGRRVTVITTQKTLADGEFTEPFPDGAVVHELDWRGRSQPSKAQDQAAPVPPVTAPASGGATRKVKDLVMRMFGQIPDPRLPFAWAFSGSSLAPEVQDALRSADIIIGSCPPWPMLLAAVIVGRRFRKPVVLDYRDHFSFCHEMPGGRLAKTVERWIDRAIAHRATSLVTISGPMADYYAQFNPEVSVVLNGYDPEIMDDIRKTTEWRPRADGKPITIRYMGVITPGRVPHNLLSALAALVRRGQLQAAAFRFEIYGECDVLKDAVERGYPELAPSFGFFSRVRYRESLQLAVTADYLLFCETPSIASAQEQSSAQGVLTTKLFEYLASGRPVLADLSPETLAGETIRKAGDHHIVCASVEEFERLLGSPQFWAPCASVDHPFVRTLSRASQAQEYLRELDARVTAWQAPSGHTAARLESKATSSL